MDQKNNHSTKTKYNEWIYFATNVHSVSKLSRDRRALVEACLQKHKHAQAEEIILCDPSQVVHQLP